MDELIAKFKSSDIIGFLYPGYGCDMPKIYEEYLEQLTPIKVKENTKAFSIMTAGMYIADGALITKPLCDKIGAELMWGNVVVMPCNFDTPVPFFRIPSDNRIENIKMRAEKKLDKIAYRIESNEKSYDGDGYFATTAGKMNRDGGKSSMDKFDVKINESKCISCGKCVKLCPTHNLTISEKGQPVKTNGNCSVCLRCVNNCPTYAIRVFSDKAKKPYKQYKGPNV